MKRTLSLILALLICIALLPAAALASGEPEEEPFAGAAEAEPILSEISVGEEDLPAEAAEAEVPAEETPAASAVTTSGTAYTEASCGSDDAAFYDTCETALDLWADGAAITESQVRVRLAAVLAEHPSGSSWNTSFNGGVQCYGFARLVVHEVFGYTGGGSYRSWTYSSAGTGMYTVGRVETCTEDSVRELLSRARPGDVLQFDAGPNGHQHSQIVYDVTSTGVVIYENNWYGYNTVSLRTMTFLEFAQRQYESGIGSSKRRGTLYLFRADNYDTTTTSTGAPAELTIYDARYPSGQLPLGSAFTLRGLILSGTTITDVSAYVYDASGAVVYFYFIDPNSTSYSIETGGLDDAFRFGSLSAGSYRYVVKAVDGEGTKTLIDSAFYIASPTSYTVQYDANSGSGAPAAQSKLYGQALTLSDAVPVRRGWTFLGWADSSTASEAQYQPGDTYDRNGAVTLYAVWEQEAIVVPTAPVLTIDPDGAKAVVTGETEGLYARVALIVESGGMSGLYVTQVEIGGDGVISIPTLVIPGITVSAVSIVLVSRTADISSPTPEAITSMFMYL